MSRRVVIGVRTSISTMVTRDLGVRSRIIHRIRVNAKWLGLAQHTPYWLILKGEPKGQVSSYTQPQRESRSPGVGRRPLALGASRRSPPPLRRSRPGFPRTLPLPAQPQASALRQ